MTRHAISPTTPLDARPLGRTGLTVSRIGLGGLFVASFAAELQQAMHAVHRALELGINYIDTAPSYGNSEEVLGQALRGVPTPVIVSTKLGGRPDPFDPRNKDHLLDSVRTSLRLLGRDRIDLLMIHEPDRPGQYDWWTDWTQLQGPVLEVIDALRCDGLIGHAGLAGTTVYEMEHLVRSGRFDVVLTAFNYSLLWREAGDTVIPAAKERGMGVIVGSPLQQGALARKYDAIVHARPHWLSNARWEQFRRLYRLADECAIALPELALRFVLSNPDVDCVLMGARSAAEVEQNVAAGAAGALPADVLAAVDYIAHMVPYRPYGEPIGLGWILGSPDSYRGMGRV